MYNEGSAEFNELITKSGGNALVSRLIFSDFTLENLKKLEYYGGSSCSNDIAIGTTNMAYLDVSAITDKIITNQEFLFEVGMELADGTVEYAPMGYFTVQKPDGDEDSVSFRAYDRMQKFEKPYFSALTYPTDSANVVNELCTMCGVELATPITNPIVIAEKLEGYTCREVLGYIAGIHGFFACFDRYGKLNLCWYSETPIEKQIGLIWSLTKSQSNYKVEKITLAKDSETTYTSGTGISGINYSNPYATQAIADSIYASLGGFTYRPCEISMLDDIRLDPWDMLQVTYLDGSVLTIPVMSLSHSFTNGETKIKSFGKTDTENEYSYSGPVTQAMERMSTELLVANRIIATKVDAEWVNAHTVTADKLEATNARVDDLETNSLTAEEADLRYANITLANIDTANIDVANIGLLFAKVGLIDRATIVDGHITGYLDAVEINANSITAGTLIADRLLLKGSENGLLYALNNLGELTSTTVDTLDGGILTKRTITADKIVAESITANELDVTNIFGNSAVLNTLTSQTAFINAISTNSVVVGASDTANSALDAVNGLEIGGRNYFSSKKQTAFDENNECRLNDYQNKGSFTQFYNLTVPMSYFIGKRVILSFDIISPNGETSFAVYNYNREPRYLISSVSGYKTPISTTWIHQELTFTVTDRGESYSDSESNKIEIYCPGQMGCKVRNVKMEIGNKATDWTPAPEDISVENVYTPNTTTIDGGKITTGSIKAAQIDVNNLFAQNITATGSITSPLLQSDDYKYTGATAEGEEYSDSGMIVDLRNKIIRTPKFCLTKNGTMFASEIHGGRYYGLPETETAFIFNGFTAGSKVTADLLIVSGNTADGNTYTTYIDTDNNVFNFMKPSYFPYGVVIPSGSLSVNANITSVGDVIAGLGTDNQVSMLSLNNNLTNIQKKIFYTSFYKITMNSASYVGTVAGISSYTDEQVVAVVPIGARKSGSSTLYPAIYDGTYIRCEAVSGAVLYVYIFHY